MPYALITGACGGIGRALCDVFATEGYSVVGVDCKTDHAFPHPLLHCDISVLSNPGHAASFKEQFDRITGGELDVLINNAAVQVVKPFLELTAEDWDATIATNLMTPFWLTRLFHPSLKAARGSVINIASIHASLTKRNFVAYATSKGALVTMTKALALELAPDIRINALLPAATDTPMLHAGFAGNAEGLSELEQYHPLGRIATPEEIGRAALFLAGRQASFISGATLNVDGGIGVRLHDPR
jgi:NAD(P)-dependent dehydrogenase (short-subunit alcohol dehydrogenase family)